MRRLICLVTTLSMALAPAAPAFAGDLSLSELSGPLLLAQAGAGAAPTAAAPPTAIAQAVAKPAPGKRRLTANKLHKYLGIGALLFGAATAMSFGLAEEDENVPAGGEDEKDGGIHGALAVTATSLAAGAVATGLMYHREDVGFDQPINDPDNLHMLLTAAGAAGFAAATALEGGDGHSTFGMLGGLAMLVGVKLTW